jgi:hypothetical protein
MTWIGSMQARIGQDDRTEMIDVAGLTIWATTKATQRRKPGRSVKHRPRERVTKMSAWLMMLTCRYSADIISSRLPCSDLTPNVFCRPSVRRSPEQLMQTKEGCLVNILSPCYWQEENE